MKKLILPVMLLALIISCGKEETTPSLTVSTQNVEFESSGGSIDVKVTSNVSWTAVSSTADWCSVLPASGTNNGSIKITADTNQTLSEREATVTVSGEGQEKKITVTQDPASVEDILLGSKWEITSQGSGDPNYDDLIGTIIDLKSDKSVVATMNLEVSEGVFVEKIEGTWKMEGKAIVINGEIIGMPITLKFEIKEMTETLMNCQMKENLGLIPPDGIPVVLTKI